MVPSSCTRKSTVTPSYMHNSRRIEREKGSLADLTTYRRRPLADDWDLSVHIDGSHLDAHNHDSGFDLRNRSGNHAALF